MHKTTKKKDIYAASRQGILSKKNLLRLFIE